jgi:chromosomal replication initiation ATPase DnaA
MKQKRINRLILEFAFRPEVAERIYDICHHYEPDAAQPSKIIDIVMDVYRLDFDKFKANKSRKHKDYFPRVCLSFFLRKYSKASMHQIARYTGRTQASILNHFKQIESLQYYPDFLEKFRQIEKIISKRLA